MIKDQLNRTSVRNYLPKKIEKSKINILKKVINASPTAKNFQCFSAIFITNKTIKQKLSNINWNQKHIIDAPLVVLFCADNNRIDMCTNKTIHTNEEYILAVIDATIGATNAVNAAIELGLGTCYLGGIRFQADTITKTLNLKGSITPVLGLCVGYPNKIAPKRPKINKCYDEKYYLAKVKQEMKEYDKLMLKYYKKVFNKDYTFTIVNKKSFDKFDIIRSKKILRDQFKIK